MNAIDILVREHDTIHRGLYLLRSAGDRIGAGGSLPGGLRAWIVGFFRAFADQCHHAKEEQVLFPRLAGRSVGGFDRSIEQLTEEHVEFRGYLRQLEQADLNRPEGRQQFIAVTREYVTCLRAHIWQENNETFPMAREVLSPGELTDLTEAFVAAERDCGVADCLDHYGPVLKRWEVQVCHLG